MSFWDIDLRTVGHFSGFMCMMQQHQCVINACNVRPTPVMVEKPQVWPDITVLPMGHYRRVYNGSPIVHNRFLDASAGSLLSHIEPCPRANPQTSRPILTNKCLLSRTSLCWLLSVWRPRLCFCFCGSEGIWEHTPTFASKCDSHEKCCVQRDISALFPSRLSQ